MLHRDGLIAALERPRWHAHYRNADLIDQAAVLAEGLLRSHAWVDGNKRTTWVAAKVLTYLLYPGSGDHGRRRRPQTAHPS
jgi:prophage maintenance system killer protein